MKIITDEKCVGYASPGHPEKPFRVARTAEKLRAQTDIAITWSQPGPTNEAAIARAHSAAMIERLNQPKDFDPDTPYHPGIAQYARTSVGAALEALRCARAGEMVFSLMRPPGHHATHKTSMGFCYLNNIAIATLEALATGVRRVAVFDFDVHHGNGTEDILLNHAGTAFFSVHQHPCYPGSGAANVGDNCFNFPVPPHCPREDYRKVFAKALDGVKQFHPELIAVSAGFDAYVRDPLAEESLEAEDFYWLGKSLREIGVPMFSLLEGGYSKDLPELVLAYLKGLDGK
jgi:acetoin utilization deacetylase AcuC-like enzyme